ncbi:hypothetical protein [Reyranella sp.]|uniref:hypothetical protein n=1 Tax=Reyranella sp. TaxID=1929291 RepID=UPI00378350E6
MDTTTDKAAAVARRYRRPTLTWIDFLVIGAIVLTFSVVLGTTITRNKASAQHQRTTVPEFSSEIGLVPSDANLIKARIRLASGGPWG